MKLKDYIILFSKKERRGIVTLLLLLLLLYITPNVYTSFFVNEEKILSQLEIINLDSLQKNDTLSKENLANESQKNIVLSLKHFSENDWLKVGIQKRVVSNIKRYLDKGWKISSFEKIKTIYGINEIDIYLIKKYLDKNEFSDFRKKVEVSNELLEINSLDSLAWLKLSGIGPYFASKILKYKKMLGGFYSVEQLQEVYHFPPETYLKIKNRLSCNKNEIQKININTADIFVLSKHPYLSQKQSIAILERISHQGKFNKLKELLQDSILNEGELKKVEYYFTAE